MKNENLILEFRAIKSDARAIKNSLMDIEHDIVDLNTGCGVPGLCEEMDWALCTSQYLVVSLNNIIEKLKGVKGE